MLSGMVLDCLPDLVDRTAGTDCCDAEVERPSSLLDQPERWLVDVADEKGGGGVAVHAVHVEGHVDIDVVAVGVVPRVGNAVQMTSLTDAHTDFG